MKKKNHYQATVIGLTLAITAPTDADTDKVMTVLNGITHNLTYSQLERAKAEAIENVKNDTLGLNGKRVYLAPRGSYETRGRRVWRLI